MSNFYNRRWQLKWQLNVHFATLAPVSPDFPQRCARTMKKALQVGGPSHRVSARFYWSGREDLNLRPLGPEPSHNSLIYPMNRALRRDGMPTACLFGCSDPAHTAAELCLETHPPQVVPAFATWGGELDQIQVSTGAGAHPDDGTVPPGANRSCATRQRHARHRVGMLHVT
jgi:hypothetical protein